MELDIIIIPPALIANRLP